MVLSNGVYCIVLSDQPTPQTVLSQRTENVVKDFFLYLLPKQTILSIPEGNVKYNEKYLYCKQYFVGQAVTNREVNPAKYQKYHFVLCSSLQVCFQYFIFLFSSYINSLIDFFLLFSFFPSFLVSLQAMIKV